MRSALGIPGIVPVPFRTHVMTAGLRWCGRRRCHRLYTGIRKSDALAEQQDKAEGHDRQSTCLSVSEHDSHGSCVVYSAFDLDQPDAPDALLSMQGESVTVLHALAVVCDLPPRLPAVTGHIYAALEGRYGIFAVMDRVLRDVRHRIVGERRQR